MCNAKSIVFGLRLIRTKDELQSRFHGDASTEIQEKIDNEQAKAMPRKREKGRSKVLKQVFQYVEGKQKLLFWILLYTMVVLAIYAERAYRGLLRILILNL